MSEQFEQKRVWDLVTRLWHWLLVVSFSATWVLGEFMEFETVDWHFYLGYLVLALIGFRIVWGFIGPEPIRFRTLFRSSLEIGPYLKHVRKRQPSGVEGHNPVGSLSVILMVVCIGFHGVIGLFAESDDFFVSGPLADMVSGSLSSELTHLHHIMAKVLLLLVGLHIGAILFYLIWKRENLINAMITGWKMVKRDR